MTLIAQNKKAHHDYEILEKFETGIVLRGYEMKALRQNLVNLKGSYVSLKEGEVWTQNVHIGAYKHAAITDYDPIRKRKLLLTKREIAKLTSLVDQKGITIIPLDIHLKNNFAKMTIGVCRGKKLHDKRSSLKQKAAKKEIDQALKNFNH